MAFHALTQIKHGTDTGKKDAQGNAVIDRLVLEPGDEIPAKFQEKDDLRPLLKKWIESGVVVSYDVTAVETSTEELLDDLENTPAEPEETSPPDPSAPADSKKAATG